MEDSVQILLLLAIYSSVIMCSPIKEDERVKIQQHHTKILETVPNVTGSSEDLPLKSCSEEASNVPNDQRQGNFRKVMIKLPANMYLNNLQYGNEFMVPSIPQSRMEFLAAINRNWYQNTYARNSFPILDTLPSVYLTRPGKIAYHENIEPFHYDPELYNSQKTVLVPITLTPKRTTSEEDFWAQISQDAIMKNIIPTMEVPMPHDPYGQYNQLYRSPYPLSAQELMTNDGEIVLYPENELRDFEHPILYRFKPKASSETEFSEHYPHTDILTTE